MLAAYQAALNTFVNNRNPQQGGSPPQQQNSSAGQAQSTGAASAGAQQQQPHSQQAHPNAVPAAAHQQASMYAMHAAPMLAYMPVLVSLHSAHCMRNPSMCDVLCMHLCLYWTGSCCKHCFLQLGVLAVCPKVSKHNVFKPRSDA